MKNLKDYLLYAMCIVAIAFSAGSFVKVYASRNSVASAAAAPGQPVDLTYATDKALPSVVTVRVVTNSRTQTVEMEDPFSDFFDPFGFFGRGQGGTQRRQVQTPKRQGSGSGVIISEDGYIVTNNHVVDGADEITVILTDNHEYSARIIGNDANTDLALIKVDAKQLPAISIGDSQKLKVGEWVIAIGNPFSIGTTVTAGIVSAKARSMAGSGSVTSVQSFIQTDAAINRGNSGGALVNVNGELVGINSMLYSETGSYSGYGFAIPTSIMNKVVEDLKKYGAVQRALIGIQGKDLSSYVDQLKQEGRDVPDFGTVNGIYVAKVEEDGAGGAAGLKDGDIITAIDNQPLTKMAELQEYLAKKQPGDKVQITYLRNKSKKTTQVTLKNAQGGTAVMKPADMDVLGAQFRPVTDAERSQLEIGYGLKVTKVNKGAIKNAGINEGFVIISANDTPMRSVNDLQDAVKAASTSRDPVLYIKGVYPTGRKGYFAIQLESE